MKGTLLNPNFSFQPIRELLWQTEETILEHQELRQEWKKLVREYLVIIENIAITQPDIEQEEDKQGHFCNTFLGAQAGNLDRIAQATSFTSNRIDVMGKEERSAADDPEDSALTQARLLAAADSITRAGEEGKLHSTMAEAFGLAPRLRRPDLLLN